MKPWTLCFVGPRSSTQKAENEWSFCPSGRGPERRRLLPGLPGEERDTVGRELCQAFAGTQPEGTSWEELAGAVASVILISSEVDASLGGVLPKGLSEKPRVVIDPFKRTPALNDQVVIPTALPGLESDGIFFRADGLPLMCTASRVGAITTIERCGTCWQT